MYRYILIRFQCHRHPSASCHCSQSFWRASGPPPLQSLTPCAHGRQRTLASPSRWPSPSQPQRSTLSNESVLRDSHPDPCPCLSLGTSLAWLIACTSTWNGWDRNTGIYSLFTSGARKINIYKLSCLLYLFITMLFEGNVLDTIIYTLSINLASYPFALDSLGVGYEVIIMVAGANPPVFICLDYLDNIFHSEMFLSTQRWWVPVVQS